MVMKKFLCVSAQEQIRIMEIIGIYGTDCDFLKIGESPHNAKEGKCLTYTWIKSTNGYLESVSKKIKAVEKSNGHCVAIFFYETFSEEVPATLEDLNRTCAKFGVRFWCMPLHFLTKKQRFIKEIEKNVLDNVPTPKGLPKKQDITAVKQKTKRRSEDETRSICTEQEEEEEETFGFKKDEDEGPTNYNKGQEAVCAQERRINLFGLNTEYMVDNILKDWIDSFIEKEGANIQLISPTHETKCNFELPMIVVCNVTTTRFNDAMQSMKDDIEESFSGDIEQCPCMCVIVIHSIDPRYIKKDFVPSSSRISKMSSTLQFLDKAKYFIDLIMVDDRVYKCETEDDFRKFLQLCCSMVRETLV